MDSNILKAKELRKKAWEALKGHYWVSLVAAIALGLLSATICGTAFLPGAATGVSATTAGTASMFNDSYDIQSLLASIPRGLLIGGGIGLLIFCIASILFCVIMSAITSSAELGYCLYNIKLVNGDDAQVSDILSRTSIMWKALWLEILMAIKIILWSLLFIIPGIIAVYRYSMAGYILAENPELSASEAIKQSKEIMKGNKWKLFCLQFSFIGWDILSMILLIVFAPLLLVPYTAAANAAFYLNRTGR